MSMTTTPTALHLRFATLQLQVCTMMLIRQSEQPTCCCRPPVNRPTRQALWRQSQLADQRLQQLQVHLSSLSICVTHHPCAPIASFKRVVGKHACQLYLTIQQMQCFTSFACCSRSHACTAMTCGTPAGLLSCTCITTFDDLQLCHHNSTHSKPTPLLHHAAKKLPVSAAASKPQTSYPIVPASSSADNGINRFNFDTPSPDELARRVGTTGDRLFQSFDN